MHSLKKSVKPEIVNRYDLWVLRHKIGGAKTGAAFYFLHTHTLQVFVSYKAVFLRFVS
jgi:hypothetical protein